MRLLLDTHCWLWWLVEPERLSDTAREAITSLDNELWLSVASIWEIGIKFKIGKLKLPQAPEILIPQQMQADRLEALSIKPYHALKAAALPLHHKDPFDRILIAQTQVEKFLLLTNNTAFELYNLTTLW
ncbi:MAG: type II toxin-antitoxin system VapC family toxin [Moorea sp. SIO2B7]|nr:type II toxin-antitoxin system VapC family toxin [Moorena sp. SIO2B7]